MNQQVNLYHPMFRRTRPVFSASALLQALAVTLVGLGLLYGYPAWQVHILEGEVAGLERQREATVASIADLDTSLPRREKSKLLASEVERLARQVGQRQALLELFTERVTGRSYGLSDYLEGLARQRVDGLWLTGLSVTSGGDALEISGTATSPELVPMLVRRLSDESAFDGASFSYLTLDRQPGDERPEDGPLIDFTLRTWSPE